MKNTKKERRGKGSTTHSLRNDSIPSFGCPFYTKDRYTCTRTIFAPALPSNLQSLPFPGITPQSQGSPTNPSLPFPVHARHFGIADWSVTPASHQRFVKLNSSSMFMRLGRDLISGREIFGDLHQNGSIMRDCPHCPGSP